MSNENTIYKCPNDETKWYGANNSPEVCPVCSTPGELDEIQPAAPHGSGAPREHVPETSNEVAGDGLVTDETPIVVTESEAQEAADNAITREEAIEQGIDVEDVEKNAIPVEVVPDATDSGTQEVQA